jgi:hypothetical protein
MQGSIFWLLHSPDNVQAWTSCAAAPWRRWRRRRALLPPSRTEPQLRVGAGAWVAVVSAGRMCLVGQLAGQQLAAVEATRVP